MLMTCTVLFAVIATLLSKEGFITDYIVQAGVASKMHVFTVSSCAA